VNWSSRGWISTRSWPIAATGSSNTPATPPPPKRAPLPTSTGGRGGKGRPLHRGLVALSPHVRSGFDEGTGGGPEEEPDAAQGSRAATGRMSA
jgi:hypothetical protein